MEAETHALVFPYSVLGVCLDTIYFAENWKLIVENIIAK